MERAIGHTCIPARYLHDPPLNAYALRREAHLVMTHSEDTRTAFPAPFDTLDTRLWDEMSHIGA